MKEKKRRLKKIGKTILLAILVLAALIYAPIWDIAPPDVADLAVVRVEVPPEENAYTCFLQATNLMWKNVDFPFSLYRQGRTNDEAVVSAYITTNQPVIAWIRLGVERQHCQLPSVEKWSPDAFSSFPLSAFMDIGKLIAIQARFERLQGRMSEATDTCLLLLRFGNRLLTASDSIVDYLIANAIVGRGLGQADDLAHDQRCGATERERLAAGLAELSSLDYADHPLRKIDSALTADDRQGMIAESSITGQGTSLNRAHNRHRPYANALGQRLWQHMADSWDSVVKNKCRQECTLSGIRLLLACRAYEEATGRLPEALEDLVPDYLPAVPRDPFDGTPFRYSAERRLVYAVGENLMDDGGTDGRQQGRRRAKDILFELEQ